ncbi:hypothetical protein D915_007760 [Fasciola hepatica]|uniref:Uncharacterized protein n=1 Tax=Fasciola hepatica TaxID=6192 RepID=A0A4E0RIH8_FASHE|nr:hypothetical protein D915_007760 [Fasciola hepatica]
MGNNVCLPPADCFNQCFRKRYDRWNPSVEFTALRYPVGTNNSRIHLFPCFPTKVSQLFESRDNFRRSRITEYIAWALNRSRSPLLLDDAVSSTPIDSHTQDFNGPNSVSWMSDAASSDASHLLYREMDPYNQAAFIGIDSRASPGSAQFESSDAPKEGAWVAVTKMSDTKHGTSTSAVYLPNTAPYNLVTQSGGRIPTDSAAPTTCDEEVDGLELARLARTLWPRIGSRKKVTNNASTAARERPLSAVIPSRLTDEKSAGEIPSVRRTTPIVRPCYLDLRLTPSHIPADPVDLCGSSATQVDSPIELDWDHEPGTTCPHTHQIIPTHLTESSNGMTTYDSGFEQIDLDGLGSRYESNLFPVRLRRRVPISRPVAILPMAVSPTQSHESCNDLVPSDGFDDDTIQPTHKKRVTSRWAGSETLVPKASRMNPIANATTIPHSNLLISPSTYLPDTLLNGNPQAPACHELVDSGFVGFGGSYAEHESEASLCRPTEFLWEHEVFDSPHSPRLTSTPYS